MNKTLGAAVAVLLILGAAVAFMSRSSDQAQPKQAQLDQAPAFSYTDEQFATKEAAAATIDADLQQIDAELEMAADAEFNGADLSDAELGL